MLFATIVDIFFGVYGCKCPVFQFANQRSMRIETFVASMKRHTKNIVPVTRYTVVINSSSMFSFISRQPTLYRKQR